MIILEKTAFPAGTFQFEWYGNICFTIAGKLAVQEKG